MILVPYLPSPKPTNSVGFGEGERASPGTTSTARAPFPLAARVPATTRMRCMTRSPHACRAPSALRERTDTGRGDWGGRDDGVFPSSAATLPSHTTAISFSHSNVGGAGLACRGWGWGREWQKGALSGMGAGVRSQYGEGGLQIVQLWC